MVMIKKENYIKYSAIKRKLVFQYGRKQNQRPKKRVLERKIREKISCICHFRTGNKYFF